MSKLKRFSASRATYICPTIVLSEEKAKLFRLYEEYCIEKGLIEGVDPSGTSAIDLLIENIVTAFIEEDKSFAAWTKTRPEGSVDLSKSFEVKRNEPKKTKT